MNEPQNLIEPDLVIDAVGRFHLKESATWGKFLGIVGFVYSLLVGCAAIGTGLIMKVEKGTDPASAESKLGGVSVIIIYGVFAGIIFLMSLHLYGFAKKLHGSLHSNDQLQFTAALKNLRVYFRLAGITTAILLVFTVLAVIGIIVTTGVTK